MRAVDRGLVDMITVISIIELMQTRRKETGRGGRLAVDVSELSQKHLNIQVTITMEKMIKMSICLIKEQTE